MLDAGTRIHRVNRRAVLRLDELDATTVSDAATLCGISKTFLYQLIAEGKGPRRTVIGKRVLVTREDRLAWLREQRARQQEATT